MIQMITHLLFSIRKWHAARADAKRRMGLATQFKLPFWLTNRYEYALRCAVPRSVCGKAWELAEKTGWYKGDLRMQPGTISGNAVGFYVPVRMWRRHSTVSDLGMYDSGLYGDYELAGVVLVA